VALRLHRAGIKIIVTEIAQPLAVRRLVSFAEAVYAGEFVIEEVTAQRCEKADDALICFESGIVPVLVDPGAGIRKNLPVSVVIDGRMTKRAPGTGLDFAPFVVGLGPGFEAGLDCHAIVETMRGPFLGRVYWEGKAEADTGLPETVGAYQAERVLRAPADGIFHGIAQIGNAVKKGDVLAEVNGLPLLAHFDGVLRGLLHNGLRVRQQVKVGDLDPRNDPRLCRMASDKALAVGGGVLEAILARPEIRSGLC
jgi:xanthine dehydrogenase accessory factor